ncbi:hypothetical protein TWF696_004880 [Orbilia brochopaga]|uniref:Uncharacterized protein n=1 Tax=Orbilia brochopaga TaxID=3140254 RepID=A0AAV9V0A3_9PEZI
MQAKAKSCLLSIRSPSFLSYLLLILWFCNGRTSSFAIQPDAPVSGKSQQYEHSKQQDDGSLRYKSPGASATNAEVGIFREEEASWWSGRSKSESIAAERGCHGSLWTKPDAFRAHHCSHSQIQHIKHELEEFENDCGTLASDCYPTWKIQELLKRTDNKGKGKGKATADDLEKSEAEEPADDDPETDRAIEAARKRGESEFSRQTLTGYGADVSPWAVLVPPNLQLFFTAREHENVGAVTAALHSLSLSTVDLGDTTYRRVTILKEPHGVAFETLSSTNGHMLLLWDSEWADENDLADQLLVSWKLGTNPQWADNIAYLDPQSVDYRTISYDYFVSLKYIVIEDVDAEDTIRVLRKMAKDHQGDAIDVPGDDFHGSEGGRGYVFRFGPNDTPSTGEMALWGIEPIKIILDMMVKFPKALGKPRISSISFVLYHELESAMMIVGLESSPPSSDDQDQGARAWRAVVGVELEGNADAPASLEARPPSAPADMPVTVTVRYSFDLTEHPYLKYLKGLSRYTGYFRNFPSYYLVRSTYFELNFFCHISVPEEHIVLKLTWVHEYYPPLLPSNEREDALSRDIARATFETWRSHAGNSFIRHIMFQNLSPEAVAFAKLQTGYPKPRLLRVFTYTRKDNPEVFDVLATQFTSTTREGRASQLLLNKWGSLLGDPYIESIEFGWTKDEGRTRYQKRMPFILVHFAIRSYVQDEVRMVQDNLAGDPLTTGFEDPSDDAFHYVPSSETSGGGSLDHTGAATSFKTPPDELIDDTLLQGCYNTAWWTALRYEQTTKYLSRDSVPDTPLDPPQVVSTSVVIKNPIKEFMTTINNILRTSKAPNIRGHGRIMRSHTSLIAQGIAQEPNFSESGITPAGSKVNIEYRISSLSLVPEEPKKHLRSGRLVVTSPLALVVHNFPSSRSVPSLASALLGAWLQANYHRVTFPDEWTEVSITFLHDALAHNTIRVLEFVRQEYVDMMTQPGVMLVAKAENLWNRPNGHGISSRLEQIWTLLLGTEEMLALYIVMLKITRAGGIPSRKTWEIGTIWIRYETDKDSKTTATMSVFLAAHRLAGISPRDRARFDLNMIKNTVLKEPLDFHWERGEAFTVYSDPEGTALRYERSTDRSFHDNLSKSVGESSEGGGFHRTTVSIALRSGNSPFTFEVITINRHANVIVTDAPDLAPGTRLSDRQIDELAAIYIEAWTSVSEDYNSRGLHKFVFKATSIRKYTKDIIRRLFDLIPDQKPKEGSAKTFTAMDSLEAVKVAGSAETRSGDERTILTTRNSWNVLLGLDEISAIFVMLRQYPNAIDRSRRPGTGYPHRRILSIEVEIRPQDQYEISVFVVARDSVA